MSSFFAMIDAALRASQLAQLGNYHEALEMMRKV